MAKHWYHGPLPGACAKRLTNQRSAVRSYSTTTSDHPPPHGAAANPFQKVAVEDGPRSRVPVRL